MANAPVSPKGGGPYNMKKTIRTKGSDGDLPECFFPPREVLRVLKGINKTRRKLTICRLKRFGCINELIQDKIAMGTIVLYSTGSSMFSVPQSPIGVMDVDACLSQQSDVLLLDLQQHATTALRQAKGRELADDRSHIMMCFRH
ncbi:unnamed protein product [Triticum turgidum subsp. durum]|uniref:Uncharacterized protein n=2 Tax=Triticum TaxID=4564 RepID=A0A9R1QWJ2_TRITD|nr:unnamed protein product [Triticum turgidum subsp. durum]